MPENVLSTLSRSLRLEKYLHPSLDQEHGVSQCRWSARSVMTPPRVLRTYLLQRRWRHRQPGTSMGLDLSMKNP